MDKNTPPKPSPAQRVAKAPAAAPAAATTPPALASIAAAPASFPIVGIGASAGGLAAFEAFFSGMPADVEPGMAFVLVQHLAPDHKSILVELIRRYTRMQVFEVSDGMKVEINCTYIIPPNCDMAFLNGTLQLLEPVSPRGQRLPIDFFFRSLAADQHERAIGIVLSGTGSDGTQGLRAIKGEGGMAMVQTPDSAEYDGMPRSAIATGLVDFELPAKQMATELMRYAVHAFGKPSSSDSVAAPKTESAFKKVFVLLRAQTRHDFSQYKPSTIHRRIERRMAVNQIEALEGYVKYLQQTPSEVEALFRDLLIGVTNFFRDADAFAALEAEGIPKLFENKEPGALIRVWCPGCSTGEEAYSIAILLQERLDVLKVGSTVQVFATDIDSRAIATARAGQYPASIALDITPARLARFFSAGAQGTGYRIHKSIRDMLVFSEQNVIKDPPFSKLDLISCRNLLIYLGADLQKKLIPLFHYALNPGGFLFLGTSETTGEFNDLFSALSRKAKLYQRKTEPVSLQRLALGHFGPPITVPDSMPVAGGPKNDGAKRPPLRELTEQALLQQLAVVGALVNEKGDILYLHGRSGMYLEPAAGEAGVNNILNMARDGLRKALTVSLHKAATMHRTMREPRLSVKTNGHHTLVNLSVSPVGPGRDAPGEQSLYLVLLEELSGQDATKPGLAPARTATTPAADESDATDQNLKQELAAKEEYLQSTIEELETSTEELKSSNEEMQSVNEELQSTNEEMETSKEELQSLNEELATVNAELQTKVLDLSRANNDMNNLLSGTGIGTVFVDHQLRILRFTPAASTIINLIASDVGRPIGHILPNLKGYDRLVADTRSVLATLVPKAVDVQTTEGHWYTLRIQPYRTTDNVIEGAVISFIDIAEIVQARQALAKANDMLRLAVVLRDASDAITVQDLTGHIIAWNPGAVRLYGWSEAQALQMNVRHRIPAGLQDQALADVHQLSQAGVLEPCLTQRLANDGRLIEISLTSTALIDEAGKMYAIATTERAKEAKLA
jgi:two-component system CheB/CheR fusion protein